MAMPAVGQLMASVDTTTLPGSSSAAGQEVPAVAAAEVEVAARAEAAVAAVVAVAVAERERLDFPILAAPAVPVAQAAKAETAAPGLPEAHREGAVLVAAPSRSSLKGS
jgi:hypothetical protein